MKCWSPRLPETQAYFERGQIVRVGQTSAETFGASLREVVEQLNAETQDRLERLRKCRQEASRQIKQRDRLLEKLQANIQPLQLDLFRPVQSEILVMGALTPVFSEKLAHFLLSLPAKEQQVQVARRRQRLEIMVELYRQQVTQLSQELRQQEATVVRLALRG